MQYKRYTDAKDFYNAAYAVFMRHEAQNSLPLGNAILGNKGGEPEGWRNTANWFMASVADDKGGVLLAAIMTPPFNITLYEKDNVPNNAALFCLCENMQKEGVPVPGVTSEMDLAERFAAQYTKKDQCGYHIHKSLRIYTLEKVAEDIPLVGTIRKAEAGDLHFLPYWSIGFSTDCDLGEQSFADAVSVMQREIQNGSLYLLEAEGMPVAMASALREIITGRCIGKVYTPPYFRNKGYASACVAQLSQTVLDMGYQYTSLFTDLANPTSNSIYQKIGYRPICDYAEIRFSK